MTKALEEKGIRLDTLRKRLRSDVARERLARMPSHDYEDRLDHPLIPKMWASRRRRPSSSSAKADDPRTIVDIAGSRR